MNESIESIESIELNEMTKVGYLDPKIQKLSFFVNTNDNDNGNIPHFHVWKLLKGRKHKWEVCIKFESAEYFNHNNYDKKLPSKIPELLNNMLQTIDPSDRFQRTFWEIAIDEWNRNNDRRPLPLDLKQPDYSKLK